jgi:ribA/ribD-fused uncharacterized protein
MCAAIALKRSLSSIPGGSVPRKTTFSSRDPLNHGFSNFNASIDHWDGCHKSPEHFMGHWRARLLGDDALAAHISALKKPSSVHHVSEPLRAKMNPTDYILLTGELLVAGNIAKYSQHANLRKKLFAVHGELVESNTGQSVWNCGLNSGDARIADENSWPEGCHNLAGIILNYTRDFLAKGTFKEEYMCIFSDKLSRSDLMFRSRSGSNASIGSNCSGVKRMYDSDAGDESVMDGKSKKMRNKGNIISKN